MRLLNTTTLRLETFSGDYIPAYSILSHVWGDNEVTYNDLISGTYRHLDGFRKLDGCCRVSRREGYSYTWIDTCCIDKSSSSELLEAITSMFQWYERAQVCYAYLEDVGKQHTALKNSRWFRRGWTLQELLAPSVVVILDVGAPLLHLISLAYNN